MNRFALGMGLTLAIGLSGCAAQPDASGHNKHQHAAPTAAAQQHAHDMAEDTRQLVTFPDPLRIRTLSNMRDHLLTIGEIQAALAAGSFDMASQLAEQRLGMSSLVLHGAHDVARYMPKGMQDAGTAMHRSASQFAITVKDASTSTDLKPVLASLAKLNQTCVACHAAYRLQ